MDLPRAKEVLDLVKAGLCIDDPLDASDIDVLWVEIIDLYCKKQDAEYELKLAKRTLDDLKKVMNI